jgi:hypothetical protein
MLFDLRGSWLRAACHTGPGATLKSYRPLGALVTGALLAALGCSSADSGSDSFSAGVPGPAESSGGASSSGGGGGGAFAGGDDGGLAALPPEPKVENLYEAPVATGHIVWIANPTSGNVAYIDAKTFAVQTVAAGNAPTYLAAVPDPTDDVAIVQNVLSQDATLLRVHAGQITATTYPSTPDANAWAISGGGRWALAWANAEFVQNPDPTQGFQEVEVIDLSGQVSPIVLNVGYRPSQIVFSPDESHAYAVTEDGLSVLDLTGQSVPAAVALYPLSASGPPPQSLEASAAPEASAPEAASPEASTSDGASEDAGPQGGGGALSDVIVAANEDGSTSVSTTPDVSFTPDAQYALVRIDGSPVITMVSMADGTAVPVALPSPATDLTIAPGTGAFAVAVMRELSEVAILPLPGVFSDPTSFTTVSIPNQVIGRALVTADGKSALLFTAAAPVPALTVLTLGAQPSYRTVTLHAPVLAVFPTPDGRNAVVLHQVTPTPGSTIEGAFSIVPVTEDLPPIIQGVPAPPTAVAIDPTSSYALVSIRDDTSSTFGFYLGLMPSLQIIPYTLASAPIAVGMAAGASRGYVAQDYPEGRITFVDLNGASGCDASTCNPARTITGFELASRIVNGGTP